MVEFDLDDFVLAGYTLIREHDRPSWIKSELVPRQVVSISPHIGKPFRTVWGWSISEDFTEDLVEFGIPAKKHKAFYQWFRNGYSDDPGAVDTISSRNFAYDLAVKFVENINVLHLIGVALPTEHAEKYWTKAEDFDYVKGLYRVISQRRAVPKEGVALGFDIVGISHGGFECSWFCSYAEQRVFVDTGIKPGEYGLIQNYEDALKVDEWVNDDVNQEFVDPIPFFPWLLVEYPLE